MTVSGAPRSEACRKANSRTGRDAAVPSAPTSTRSPVPARSPEGRQTTTAQCACRVTDALTDPRIAEATGPRPREPTTTRSAASEASTSATRGSASTTRVTTSRSGAVTSAFTRAAATRARAASPSALASSRWSMPWTSSQAVSRSRSWSAQCTTVRVRCSRAACWAAHVTARSASGEPSTPTTMLPRGTWKSVMAPAFSPTARRHTAEVPGCAGPRTLPLARAGPEAGRVPVLRELDRAECERLLRRGTFGRVVLVTHRGPDVVPVNYTVVGDAVVVRTAPDGTLARHGHGRPIAFEVGLRRRRPVAGLERHCPGCRRAGDRPAHGAGPGAGPAVGGRRPQRELHLQWTELTGRQVGVAWDAAGALFSRRTAR